jgi:hypothetical protein
MAQRQCGGRGNAADFRRGRCATTGVLDGLHRLGQLGGHGWCGARVEHRRVAVGVGERFGDRVMSRATVEHGAHRTRRDSRPSREFRQVQDFEQVELDVTNIGDVVAQGFSSALANCTQCP